NLAYRIARRMLPLTRRYHGSKFIVRTKRGFRATPLLIVLLMVETSDVVFALDSIPAVFGISQDPFIVFTSNVCAVLGLRAMFFLPSPVDHEEVLQNTEAASLIADIDPHASLSTSIEVSSISRLPDEPI